MKYIYIYLYIYTYIYMENQIFEGEGSCRRGSGTRCPKSVVGVSFWSKHLTSSDLGLFFK